MKTYSLVNGFCARTAILLASVIFPAAAQQPAGFVYAMTNDAAANSIAVYQRGSDGSLVAAGMTPTQGLGTGAGLGSQGALTTASGGRFLLAVNGGSNEVTVFLTTGTGLQFRSKVSSGGATPISVTASGDAVFVLNAGGTPNIQGFRLGPLGTLHSVAAWAKPVKGVAPAQVGFNPSGDLLAVTGKGSNTIETYQFDGGTLSESLQQPSSGQTPFGFVYDRRGHMIVTEAFGGTPGLAALSSYDVAGDGTISPVTASLGNGRTAMCWVILSKNERYAYTANTGSSTISQVALGKDGSLQFLVVDAAQTGEGASPIDLAITGNGRYLYSLNFGAGTVTGYRINADGSLTPAGSIGGLPSSVAGLIAE